MNNQVKLIDADKLLKWIEKDPKADGFWLGICGAHAFNNLAYAISSGEFAPDTPPVPTIKPGESHACPKCGEQNCFTTPIEELNASCFMCSFCNQRSPKDDWR